ncbi:hypothetical protein Mal64_08760 [Pseudobythopirellula maris]|uniref:Proteasome subunit n=1 Tax=Pseudobythopirellula maris TaxID=2527991 RepID=A0A5C5ZTR9_9BACT|nr:proteasome-type protease [Pseudobythopirellula maris]TWT90485.1 hypothetical protein Mal64_08760 [Pseudobythopirellula maris]
MTFCVGIEVREGIVALADTRIVRGSEHVNKQKIGTLQHGDRSVFTMTSGLRSVRDKTHCYLEEVLRCGDRSEMRRLYEFANLFGEQLRRVKAEDGPSLSSTGHSFNLHAILGGRLADDERPRLHYVYPEGNWVTTAEDSPYFMIGRTYYGRPILDRLLDYETPLRSAVALAVMAFDATRSSVTDVGFPIDVAVLAANQHHPTIVRYSESDLAETTQWWAQRLKQSLAELPVGWADPLLSSQIIQDNQNVQTNQSGPNGPNIAGPNAVGPNAGGQPVVN